MDTAKIVLFLVAGLVLLFTGKKLYWLFVALVGFVIGLTLTTQYVQLTPHWLVYVVALGIGIIGAILTIFLQKFAIALAGFVVGGLGAYYLAGLLNIKDQPIVWLAFIIGAIVGLFLVASVFNWALYILSAWAGSTLVTKAITDWIGLQARWGLVLFFVLFVAGVIIQAGLYRDRPKQPTAVVVQEAQPPKKDE